MLGRALVLAALVLAALSAGACDGGEPATGCARDQDCPSGGHCVTETGVCVDFRNPLDAAVPDLAGPDLVSADALAD
jgi:hypothetical protein